MRHIYFVTHSVREETKHIFSFITDLQRVSYEENNLRQFLHVSQHLDGLFLCSWFCLISLSNPSLMLAFIINSRSFWFKVKHLFWKWRMVWKGVQRDSCWGITTFSLVIRYLLWMIRRENKKTYDCEPGAVRLFSIRHWWFIKPLPPQSLQEYWITNCHPD